MDFDKEAIKVVIESDGTDGLMALAIKVLMENSGYSENNARKLLKLSAETAPLDAA